MFPITQAYTLLVLWSPNIIVPRASEKTYRSPRKPSARLPLGSVSDSPSVDLTVVIPAYNETERLPTMFSTTLAHLESTRSSRSYEVLVVDDGSRDDTAALALKLGAQYTQSEVRVVVLEKNVGKGGAVRHGMLHGRGKRLLMVDADGASRFEDLEALWKAMDEISPKGEAAVVVGSRAHLVKTEAVVKVRAVVLCCSGGRNVLSVFGNDVPTAVVYPECAHVRAAHDPARCRGRAHPRHAVWVQAVLTSGCATDLPIPAPGDMDLRRGAAAAGEGTRDGGGRGGH